MTEHEKYLELKKGFNKVQSKKIKWKSRYYHEKQKAKLAFRYLSTFEIAVTNNESNNVLQKLIYDFHDDYNHLMRLIELQGRFRRNNNGKRKRSR